MSKHPEIILPTRYDGPDANLSDFIGFRVTPKLKAELLRSARRRGFPTLSAFFQRVAILQVQQDQAGAIPHTETEAA